MIPSLTPADLDFPPKFRCWRPGQIQAINRGLTSSRRFIAHSMPVGEGKSGYYMAHALLGARRTCILTSSKTLQTQLIGDFSTAGLADIRGRNNYHCSHQDCVTGTCEEGQYYRCDPSECEYEQERAKAMTASIVETNYSYFMLSSRYGRGLGKFDLLVCDEAHSVDLEVCAAASINITFAEANKIGIRLPHESAGMPAWWAWATEAGEICKSSLDALKEDADAEKRTTGRVHPTTAKDLRFWGYASEKCIGILDSRNFVGDAPPPWIVDRTRDGYHLEPVWASQYAEKLLFQGIPRIVLVSATMVRKTLALLGIPESDCDYYEYPSSFPPASSPVYIFGQVRVDHRTNADQMAVWMSKIDNILRLRQDRKGVIHTVSYDRAGYIKQNSEFSDLILAPKNGKETQAAIDEFNGSQAPLFLASPAITTGLDWPYSRAELNLIAKVPFLDLRDPITSARTSEDPDYAPYVTAQTIVQAYGRTMRASDDRSECFICDAHFGWFFYKFRYLFPKWFHRLVQSPLGMPQPPAPLNRDAVLITPAVEPVLDNPLSAPPAFRKVVEFPKSKTS